jgi:hypothetical protein
VPALLRALRFMRVVPPVPSLMWTAWLGVTLASGVAVAAGTTPARDALTPLLVLQVFAVSTGFATAARRGHYDVLLTGGTGRVRTAVAQWTVAAMPGLAGWLALAAVEIVLTPGAPDVLAPGGVAAMFVVSTLPWALTVGLPRFSAAIGWVLLCALAVSLAPGVAGDRGVASGGAEWVLSAVGVLLFPMRMVEDPGLRSIEILPAVIVAAGSMAGALVWIARRDVPLEAGQ